MNIHKNTRWSVDFLQSKRQQTDQDADEAVLSILSDGVDREKAVQDVLNLLIENQDPIPQDLPPSVKTFFEKTKHLPDWADPGKLRIGAEVFADFGPEIVWILFCRSLPLCYACAHGAEVLVRTGRLNHPEWDKYRVLNRRIMETAQFMMCVLERDGFEPGGQAIVAVQKIRLIHAAIRHFIGQHEWDSATLGEPINQEDMAGTLMSFSIAIIEGLRLLHVPLTRAQEEAYLHLWKVVGHLIGLQADLLPEDVADASALEQAILDHQVAASPAGRDLTVAIIEYLRHLLVARFARRFPEVLIRYLVDHHIADILEVKRSAPHLPFHFFLGLARWQAEREVHSRAFRWLVEKFNLHLLQGLIDEQNPVKGGHFKIPPSLSGSWGLFK